jgi:hypothetical protein
LTDWVTLLDQLCQAWRTAEAPPTQSGAVSLLQCLVSLGHFPHALRVLNTLCPRIVLSQPHQKTALVSEVLNLAMDPVPLPTDFVQSVRTVLTKWARHGALGKADALTVARGLAQAAEAGNGSVAAYLPVLLGQLHARCQPISVLAAVVCVLGWSTLLKDPYVAFLRQWALDGRITDDVLGSLLVDASGLKDVRFSFCSLFPASPIPTPAARQCFLWTPPAPIPL